MVSSQTLPRSTLPDGYPQLLARLKREIGAARTRAALAVNEELITLYWRIGKEILERQQQQGWGGRVIERLAADLRAEFPEMKGFSRSNIHYMRQFAAAWPDQEDVPQPVGQLPWGHVRCLLDKLDSSTARLWYAQRAVEHAWSRNLLEHHIATGRYEREGKALTNFAKVLPDSESELVQQIVHEDYNSGQINFYVNVVDAQMRQEHHDATIGLVLCASRNETVARYALNGIDRPIGVARYRPTSNLAEQVPEELHNQLPELAEISAGVQLIVERHADEVAEAEAGNGEA